MIDLKCKNCSRHFGEVKAIVGEILCYSCKGTTQFKILVSDQSQLINHKFTTPERPPKKKAVS